MAARIPFPEPPLFLSKPSSRSYTPGTYPNTEFESLDGTKTHIRYGNKRVNATLTLGFSNIPDKDAALILINYEAVNSDWNYVIFSSENGLAGLGDGLSGFENTKLSNWVQETDHVVGISTSLKWRYSSPPSITSTFNGRSNVSCSFVACLDAPI